MTTTEPSAAQLPPDPQPQRRVHPGLIALAWVWVAIPSTYGLWKLFTNIPHLFTQ